MRIYLATVTPYIVASSTLTTLYYGTKGFTTEPGDTPANTYFEPRIKQPAAMRRDMFASGTTMGASRVSIGELVLLNGDGELDTLLGYAFDGRAISIYQGEDTGTFPTDFDTLLVGTVEQAEFTRDEVRLRIRDKQLTLEKPLQPTLYAGNNTLPDGVEGVADLEGKPKPILYGTVKNISPPCVNTSKLVYQISEDAITSVDGVYDRGIPIGHSWESMNDATPTGFAADPIRGAVYDSKNVVPPIATLVGDSGKIAQSGGTLPFSDVSGDWGTTDIFCVVVGSPPSSNLYVLGGDAGTLYTYANSGLGAGGGTSRTSQFGANAIRAGIYIQSQNRWVIVGDGGKISSSDDSGETWAAETSGVATALYGIALHRDNRLVVCGASGVLLYSDDYGDTWTALSAPFGTTDLTAIASGRGRLVVVGDSNVVGWSADGLVWTAGSGAAVDTAGTTYDHYALTFSNGQFTAVGEQGVIATSQFGDSWTLRHFEPGVSFNTFHAVVQYGTGYTFACGEDASANGAVLRTNPPASQASEANLLNDDNAPAPGSYSYYLAGGLIRLGSPPAGLITCDATAGAASSDRTAAQMWVDVLEQAGLTSGAWSAADVTALDTANSAELGYWSGTEPVMVSEVLSLIAGSVGAWWGVDRLGVFRIARLEDPSAETADVSYVADDMVKHLERVPTADEGRGIPIYRQVIRYAKNWTPQASDLAGGVTDARRAELAQAWKEETATTASVQTAYLLAREQVDETLLQSASAAATEATRRLALRDSRCDRFEFAVPLDSTSIETDLGSYVEVTHDRFGLTSGRVFVCITVEPDAANQVLTIGVWSPS